MMMMVSSIFKVVYIGNVDSHTKNTYRNRYFGKSIQSFKPSLSNLLGADFSIYENTWNSFQIWDLELDPKFKEIRNAYIIGCKAAIILFSLTDFNSIHNLSDIVHDLWQSNGSGPFPVAFIGLRDIYSKVKQEAIHAYNNQIQIINAKYGNNSNQLKIAFFESSLQYGENSNWVFSFFSYLIHENKFDGCNELHAATERYQVKIFENDNESNGKYNLHGIIDRNVSMIPEYVTKARCIADRAILDPNENNSHCLNCNSLFCGHCYNFYLQNHSTICPGSLAHNDNHSPIFS